MFIMSQILANSWTNFTIKTKFEMQMELLGERNIFDLMFNIKVVLYTLDYSGFIL